MQDVGVWNVVKKEQQIIGGGLSRFVNGLNERRILAGESGASTHSAIHADSIMICTMPLSPPIAFRGFDPRAVVTAENVRESLRAQGTGIALIDVPGFHLQADDRLHYFRIIAEREPRPLLRNVFGA